MDPDLGAGGDEEDPVPTLVTFVQTPPISFLGKFSAQRSVKNRAGAPDTIKENTSDFINLLEPKDLTTALLGKIKNLNLKTKVWTAGKESQYDGDVDLQRLHNESKARLFNTVDGGARYEASKTSDHSEVSIKQVAGGDEVLKIKLSPARSSKNIAQVSLTDTGKYAKEDAFGVSCLLVSQLGVMAEKLCATSVTISSNKPDGSVNVDNVLRAAFTVLHKDLLPKFDAKTWAAIQLYSQTAQPFDKFQAVLDENHNFTSMYQSQQFAMFLLGKCKLEQNKDVNRQSLRNEFTGLQEELGYNKVYTDLRRP